MKNTIKTILCICLATMTAVSCENVLEKATISGRNTSNFPASEEELAQMVNSIYVTLTESVSEYPTSNYFVYANIASDDQLGGGGDSDIDIQAMDRLMYSDPDFFAGYWNKLYEGIRRANAVINADESVINEQLVGEARILRAYFYFTLAQMFEDVPIVETSNATEPYPALSGVDELYSFILADLYSALNTMTYENSPGHVDKAVAAGLLARVYMFYLGLYKNENLVPLYTYNPEAIYLREGPGTPSASLSKQSVVECLNNVIDNRKFQLVPDFRLLWPYTNSEIMKDYPYLQDLSWGSNAFEMNNPEIIFQICFSPRIGQANTMFQYFGLRQGYFGTEESFFPFNKGYGVAPVCTNIWDEWPDSDPRKMASICPLRDELEFGDWAECNDGLESTFYLQKKFQTCSSKDGEGLLKFREALSSDKYCGDGKADLGLGNSPANLTIIRFSDILLMCSELTGDAKYMNAVQNRAGLPGNPCSLENIQNERRCEFAFEGLRWGDLRRWSGNNANEASYCAKALEKQNGTQIIHRNEETNMKHPSSYAKRYAETNGFLDYPESVIQESDGLLQHKEGWDAYSAQFTRWQ